MIKLLKAFWDKCGEEKFSMQVIFRFITVCTLINIFTPDTSPYFNGFIIVLNIIIGLLVFFYEED